MDITILFIAINIAGLILDMYGFIRIYQTKYEKINSIRTSNFDYLNRLRANKPTSEAILETVNRKINEINNSYVKQDERILPFFLLVVFGVGLQLTSSLLIILYEIF